jgi:Mrp family chromosome partitioning ATPase
MEPIYYVRIVRRRLRLVLACAIVGALLGLGSSFLASDSTAPDERYLASHILWENAAVTQAPGAVPVNLTTASLLITRGEVPRTVAEQLDANPIDLLSQIDVVVNGEERTLTIHAVANSPSGAEELADTFAEEGLAALRERDREDIDNQLVVLDGQIADRNADLESQQAELATLPEPEQAAQEREIEATATALAELQAERDRIANTTLPSDRLGTLEQATAIPVTEAQLSTILSNADPQTAGSLSPGFGASTGGGSEPITDNAILRTVLGLLFGLGIGIALAVTLQRFDSKIRNKEEAEEAFGLPVIGEIPALPRGEQDRTTVIAFDAPRSPTAEAYRSLRSSLVFVGHTAPPSDERLPSEYASDDDTDHDDDPPRKAQVILVTSPGPGEGKTTSAANLAAVLAETGYSVLAINCDFRKPRLHKYLRAQDIPRKVVETAIPGVRTITDVVTDSSRLNPAEVVAAQRKVIESARELFDIIVLDTAPLLATNDATDLLGEADLVVVCCRAGKTTRDGAERTVEALKRHEAPVAGCVIVGSDEGPAASYYYYYGDHDAQAGTNGSRANGSNGREPAPEADSTTSVGAVDDASTAG